VSAWISLPEEAPLERAEFSALAFAIGFYFSCRLAIVLFSVRLVGLDPSTGSATSLGLDLMLFGIICFGSVGGAQRSVRSILHFPAMRWVLAFLAFALLSLVWSETSSLSNSFAYWMGLVIDVANVVSLLRRDSGSKDLSSMMEGFVWSSCFLALVAWIMPVQADLRLGDEQFFNTNEIGNLCVFAIFFAQYLTRSGHRNHWFAKTFLAMTLVRSLSKSTLVAFLVSQSLLLILDRSISRRTKILLASCAFLTMFVFWGLFEAYYGVYTTAGNQAETLTGRLAIWLYVLNSVFDHPWSLWIGHGFDSWWRVVPPFGIDAFEARHAENELLQQLYAFGVAGVVLLIGTYGSLFRQLRKPRNGPARALFFSFLVFIIVRGLAVADSFDLLLPLWSIVAISALLDRESTRGHCYARLES
jgi:exopolysaccharide production protein ExoQ